MNEYFRIIFNRKWIAILLLLVLTDCFLYTKSVKTDLNCLPAEASDAVEHLRDRINGLPYEKAMEILNQENEALNARQAAAFLISMNMDQEENIQRYKAKYENFEEILNDLQSGKLSLTADAEQYAVSYWLEVYPYYSGYSDRMEAIRENAEKLKNSSTFSDPHSFVFRNIEKTVTDYARCETIRISPHSDLMFRFLRTYRISDVFVLLSILAALCIIKESDERDLSILIDSFPGGRMKFHLIQLFALFTVSAVSVLCLRLFPVFFSSFLFAEKMDMNIYVQNYACFEQFTLPVKTGTYLMISAAYELFACVFCGCLFLAALSLFEKPITGASLIAVIIFAEYLLSDRYGIHDKYYYLSVANLFSLTSFWTFVNRYQNINVLSYPVSLPVLLSAVILTGTLILMYIRIHKRPQMIRKKRSLKLTAAFRRFREKNSAIHSLPFYEMKKAGIYEKGLMIPLLLIALLAMIRPYEVPRNSYLKELTDKYSGPVNESVLNEISLEREYYEERIRTSAYPETEDIYYLNAAVRLQARYEELLLCEAGDPVVLTDETDIEYLFGDSGSRYRMLSLLLVLTAAALLTPCFTITENSLRSIHLTAVSGRIKLFRSKQKILLCMVFLIFVIQAVRDLILLKKIPDDLSVSCMSYEAIGLDIPVYEYFSSILLYRLLGLVILSETLLFLDTYMKSYIAAASFNIAAAVSSALTGIVFGIHGICPGTVTMGNIVIAHPLISFTVMILISVILYFCSYYMKRNEKI